MDHNNILGVVLAGGKSQRFGEDKSQVKLGDKLLIDYILSEIIDEFNEVLVVSNNRINFKESKKIIRKRGDLVIAKTHHGFICANAGIDKSNVRNNTALLLPEDPNKSAYKFQKRFESLASLPIAVIVSDTFGRAWRKGQVNFAIGSSGISPIDSYIGKLDSFENELNATEIAVVDELASAAELVMKKTIGIPIAIIRGFDYEDSKLNANELIRDDNEDFFL